METHIGDYELEFPSVYSQDQLQKFQKMLPLSNLETLLLSVSQISFRYNQTNYENGVLITTPRMINIFLESKKKYQLLLTIHYLKIDKFVVSVENEGFLIRSKGINLIILSGPYYINVAQIIYRNIYLMTCGFAGKKKPTLSAYSEKLFPSLDSLSLTPSQQFQFYYCGLTLRNKVPYAHFIVQQIHDQFYASDFVFDFTSYLEYDEKAVPINKAASVLSYFTGFVSTKETKVSPAEALAKFIFFDPNLHYVKITSCPENTSLLPLRNALQIQKAPSVSVWIIGGESNYKYNYKDTREFLAQFVKVKSPVKVTDFTGMKFSANAFNAFLSGMLSNQNFLKLEYLGFGQAKLKEKNISHFSSYISTITSRPSTYLTGINMSCIPDKVFAKFIDILDSYHLPLRYLNIEGNDLETSKNVERLKSIISKSTTLRTLDISNTRISSSKIKDIINAFDTNDNNPYQIKLCLNSLHLKSSLTTVLTALIDSDRRRWRGLQLDSNGLSYDQLSVLVSMLPKLPNMRHLSLSFNFGHSMQGIDEMLAKIIAVPSIHTLILKGPDDNSKLRLKKNLYKLIDGLRHNTSLRKLDITNNEIGTEGMNLLSQILSTNYTLTHLNIDGNNDSDINVMANIMRRIRARTSLISVPFPVRDANKIIASGGSKNNAEYILRLQRMNQELRKSINIHRYFSDYRFTPMCEVQLPYKQEIINAAQQIENYPRMQKRRVFSCANNVYAMTMPYKNTIDPLKYEEELVRLQNSPLEAYNNVTLLYEHEEPLIQLVERDLEDVRRGMSFTDNDIDSDSFEPKYEKVYPVLNDPPPSIHSYVEQKPKSEPNSRSLSLSTVASVKERTLKESSSKGRNKKKIQSEEEEEEQEPKKKLRFNFDPVNDAAPKHRRRVRAPPLKINQTPEDLATQKVRNILVTYKMDDNDDEYSYEYVYSSEYSDYNDRVKPKNKKKFSSDSEDDPKKKKSSKKKDISSSEEDYKVKKKTSKKNIIISSDSSDNNGKRKNKLKRSVSERTTNKGSFNLGTKQSKASPTKRKWNPNSDSSDSNTDSDSDYRHNRKKSTNDLFDSKKKRSKTSSDDENHKISRRKKIIETDSDDDDPPSKKLSFNYDNQGKKKKQELKSKMSGKVESSPVIKRKGKRTEDSSDSDIISQKRKIETSSDDDYNYNKSRKPDKLHRKKTKEISSDSDNIRNKKKPNKRIAEYDSDDEYQWKKSKRRLSDSEEKPLKRKRPKHDSDDSDDNKPVNHHKKQKSQQLKRRNKSYDESSEEEIKRSQKSSKNKKSKSAHDDQSDDNYSNDKSKKAAKGSNKEKNHKRKSNKEDKKPQNVKRVQFV